MSLGVGERRGIALLVLHPSDKNTNWVHSAMLILSDELAVPTREGFFAW
ncbi:MAG TPA: hypothetical protein VHU80_05685 [Polyangiaceae bacterium]|jgi:hypothetical protein|nr:hypothetical protein [Polyangiaceae bacterium]